MTQPRTRRDLIRTVAGAGALGVATSLAGCSGGDDEADTEPDGDESTDGETVAVGPDGSLAFDPEDVTVSAGTTVTWAFESGNHNVYAYPENQDRVSIPEDAEGFGSVPKDDQFSTNDQSETYEHTFETAGEYQYVCVPHVGSGMVATVTVE